LQPNYYKIMSPRPKLTRKVLDPPGFRGFKPYGCPVVSGGEIKLLLEEYEAIKLADYEKLSQVEAANKMEVSRPTFSRIYESARFKISKAFLEIKPIVVEGGNIEPGEDWLHCNDCQTIFKNKNQQENSKNCPVCKSTNTDKINTPESVSIAKDESSEEVFCICPKCNYSLPHIPGQPCRSKYCPNCEVSLTRENSIHHKQLKKKLKNT